MIDVIVPVTKGNIKIKRCDDMKPCTMCGKMTRSHHFYKVMLCHECYLKVPKEVIEQLKEDARKQQADDTVDCFINFAKWVSEDNLTGRKTSLIP